jgi:hypothetical protein
MPKVNPHETEKTFPNISDIVVTDRKRRLKGDIKMLRELNKRQTLLNKSFVFTKSNVSKLEKINALLCEKEKHVLWQALTLKEFALGRINHRGRHATNHNIEVRLKLYDGKKFMRVRGDDWERIPFFDESLPIELPVDKASLSLLSKKNWNDLKDRGDHHLKNRRHCYTFFHLYSRTSLAWMDILDVKDVRLQTILKIQND